MKKVLAGKSFREKLLIFGLLISVVFGGYMMIAVKPMVIEAEKNDKEYKSLKSRYSKLLKETKDAKPSSTLEKELKKLTKQLEAEQQSLQGLDFSFINLDNQEAKHALIANITIAAEENQLQVLGKSNEIRDLTSLVSTAQVGKRLPAKNSTKRGATPAPSGNSATLNRHVFNLQIRGTFFSTYKFLKQLQAMENSVLVARFKLMAEDKITYQGKRLVTTDLTLAI